jgi:hypothetical protein
MPAILLVLFLIWLAVVFSPFLARGWWSLAAIVAVFLSIGLGVHWGVARFDAADVPRGLVEAGNIWLDTIQGAVPYTVAFGALGLVARSLGVRGPRLLGVYVLCVLAVPALWAAPGVWHAWDYRAAPEECLARPVPVRIGGFSIELPQHNAVRVYLGPNLDDDARYFFSRKSQRQLCGDTQNGTKARDIAALVLDLSADMQRICQVQHAIWWDKLCQGSPDRWAARPRKVTLFVPGTIRTGEFGIPNNKTMDLSGTDIRYKTVSVQTDGKRFIHVVCRSEGDDADQLYCQMRRQVTPGVDIAWDIAGPSINISNVIGNANAVANEVCAAVLRLDVCPSEP